MRLTILLPLTLAIAIPSTVLGCGGDETGDTSGAGQCFDYAKFDGTTPATTFSADVLPIFRRSCGVGGASCHGSTSGPAAQPYLGPAEMDPAPSVDDIKVIFEKNVSVSSLKDPELYIIAPGKPNESFLMHKMDNTFSCAPVKCGSACGALMPYGSTEPLPQADRDTVRRWIAQGAKND